MSPAERFEIRPLTSIQREEITPLLAGYETLEQYQVELEESDALTRFTIRLVPLEAPYRTDFFHDFEEEDFQRFQALLPQALSFGAYQGEQLVGMAICEARTHNHTVWIWELHVLNHFRGQGIGRALMEHVCQQARAQGLTHAYLETQNTNVPAVRFYRKLGFTLDALDRSMYLELEGHEGVVCFYLKRAL